MYFLGHWAVGGWGHLEGHGDRREKSEKRREKACTPTPASLATVEGGGSSPRGLACEEEGGDGHAVETRESPGDFLGICSWLQDFMS